MTGTVVNDSNHATDPVNGGQTSRRTTYVKSFVRREGRITCGQQNALQRLWPCYGLHLSDGSFDSVRTFGRNADCVLEIGFGMGDSLLTQARQMPHSDFIGIEVYRPGVGALLLGMERKGIDNIRVYAEDAVSVLSQCVADDSLAAVQIYFPDPWPKKRHHKRRLIQTPFLALLCRKLKTSGLLHMATDCQDYAEHMLYLLNDTSNLRNQSPQRQFVPRPSWRPVSKFERRAQKTGDAVYDLLFQLI